MRIAYAVLLLLVAASVQADGVYFGAGYADRKILDGAEIELGYRQTLGKFGANLAPLDGIIHSNKDSRYRKETFSDGTKICRDTTNGQFADKDKCGPGFDYGALIGVDFQPIEQVRLGGGVRVGKRTDPFVSAAFKVFSSTYATVRGGDKYLAGGVAFFF